MPPKSKVVAKTVKSGKTGKTATPAKKPAATKTAPALPNDLTLKRLAKNAGPADSKVSGDILSHIRALYVQHYAEFVPKAMENFRANNKALEKKGKPVSKTLGLATLNLDPKTKEHAKNLVHFPSKKEGINAKNLYEHRKNVLLVRGTTFKKYLTLGSDDGQLEAIFAEKFAPKLPVKKDAKQGAVPKGKGFSFRKDFLDGLQWQIEKAVTDDLKKAWDELGKKKTLSHEAFVAAGIDVGEAPEEKPKKAGGKKTGKAPAKPKKTGGKSAKKTKAVSEDDEVDESEEEEVEKPKKAPAKPKKTGSKKAPVKKAVSSEEDEDESEEEVEKPKKAGGKKTPAKPKKTGGKKVPKKAVSSEEEDDDEEESSSSEEETSSDEEETSDDE